MRPAGALDAVADADAEIAVLGARPRLAFGKAGIVDGRERDPLVGREVAAVERDRRAGAGLERKHVRHSFRRHQVAAADLGAVEAELIGDAVEQALHREGGFRIAGAAHRHGGDLVGLDHAYVERIGRQQVGAREPGRRVVREVDALRRIGAFVVDHLSAHAEEPSVVVEGDLEVPILLALLNGGEEMLAPVLDPLDRPPQDEAGGGERRLFRIEHELGAEAAADVRRHHAQPVLVEREEPHQEGARLVGELRRRPQRQPLLVHVVDRDRAAPFDRMRPAAVLLEVDAGAVRRAREGLGDVAIGLPELDEEIARPRAMGARRARGQRLPAIGDCRQRLVVDRDQRGGVLGEVARPRDHQRHRLADEGDLVLGQHERRDVGRQLRGAKLQRQPLLREQRRKLGEREHGVHAGMAPRRSGIDAADQGMGMRAAHERRLEHVGKFQIGDEAAGAGDQRAVLEAPDGAADIFCFPHRPGFFCRALAERGPIGSGWNGPSRISR